MAILVRGAVVGSRQWQQNAKHERRNSKCYITNLVQTNACSEEVLVDNEESGTWQMMSPVDGGLSS